MAVRYIAQHAVTGEILHWDLPLTDVSVRWELSAPGSLRATLQPEQAAAVLSGGRRVLEPWGTYIYAERDGRIEWGGIVHFSEFQGHVWTVEAAGFTTYPHGIPYDQDYAVIGDAGHIFADLWHWTTLRQPAPLVTVDRLTSGVVLGTAEEPYALHWYEARDVGQELDQLAADGDFEYTESHAWTQTGQVAHTVTVAKHIGARRTDLAFVQGANVTNVVPVREREDYANVVYALGSGEGSETLLTTAARDDGRLRRPYVYTDKGERNLDRLARAARNELDARSPALSVETLEVIDHPNAPLGAWRVGDSILVDATVPWVGRIRLWHRITAWERTSETRGVLTLTPA